MSDGMSDGKHYGPFLSKHADPIINKDGKPIGGKMDKYGLPEPPIELRGFKTCAHGDTREVQPGEEYCVLHGGKPLTLEGLRRSAHRSIRMAIHQMMICGDCAGIPLNDVRCTQCAWMRGAAMGIAGEAEQMGWASDMEPYMKMIGKLEPGWQKRAFA